MKGQSQLWSKFQHIKAEPMGVADGIYYFCYQVGLVQMKFVCFECNFILNGFFAAIFNVWLKICFKQLFPAMTITLRPRKSNNKIYQDKIIFCLAAYQFFFLVKLKWFIWRNLSYTVDGCLPTHLNKYCPFIFYIRDKVFMHFQSKLNVGNFYN